MASLLLKRALLSISKPLSFLGHHSAKYSSITSFFNGYIQFAAPQNIMRFRHPQFLLSNHLLSIQQTSGMKTKSALKRRCKDCFFVRRRGRLFVYCKSNGKHKQRQA